MGSSKVPTTSPRRPYNCSYPVTLFGIARMRHAEYLVRKAIGFGPGIVACFNELIATRCDAAPCFPNLVRSLSRGFSSTTGLLSTHPEHSRTRHPSQQLVAHYSVKHTNLFHTPVGGIRGFG